jgi:hypothetical protein
MGLTALILNGGALQGHQIPKGFALVIKKQEKIKKWD